MLIYARISSKSELRVIEFRDLSTHPCLEFGIIVMPSCGGGDPLLRLWMPDLRNHLQYSPQVDLFWL